MKRRFLTLIVILLSFFGTLNSQSIIIGEMVVDQLQLVSSVDSIGVTMRLDLSELSLKSNQEIELCPSLFVDGVNHTLPTVKIMGRRRYLYDCRNRNTGGQVRYSLRVKRDKGEKQQITYCASVPLKHSPQYLQFRVNGTWEYCQCGSYDVQEWILAERNYTPLVFRPHFPYVAPTGTTDKDRIEKGSAYVEFKVGSAQILPDFRKNAVELVRIGERIGRIVSDEDVLLRRILVTGYASPEGNFQTNQRLAQERTQSFIDYLMNTYEIDSDKVVVGFGDEDWKILRKYVAESVTENQTEILALIDGEGTWDEKERNLRQQYPSVYMDLGKLCFPKLRRIDYEVYYALRSFTPEESSQLIFQTPQKLSLREMYEAAKVYPQGSEPFCEALEIAVRMYPSDSVANLNAAFVALEKRQLEVAEKYLKKSSDRGETVMARGIWAYLNGDKQMAVELLQKASEQGVEGAAENLKMIEYDTNHP